MNPQSERTLYIETYGCQMNVYDTRVIMDILGEKGYRIVESPEQATVLLLNTCAVRDNAENRVLGRIGQLQQHTFKKKDALLGVVGCMAQRLGNQLLQKRKAVDLVVGTDNYHRLPEMIEEILADGHPQADIRTDGVTTYQASADPEPINNSHLISIARGCDNHCTYCIVPSTRGRMRPKDPGVILNEVKEALGVGVVEITLIGQNVTAYDHPECDFAELITRVAAQDRLRRLRFITNHPRDLTDEILRAIADQPKISSWLHLPVQSGSDRILRRMNRGYDRAHYLGRIDQARRFLHAPTFSTDIIVGFPGETEEDFQQTLDIMREVRYDSAFTFMYSPRPTTPAAKMEDDVPEEEKRSRLYRLNALQEEIWEETAQSFIGQRCEVAVEGDDQKGLGYLKARALNNRKVLIPSESGFEKGDELLVRIRGIKGSTFFADPVGLIWKVEHVDS